MPQYSENKGFPYQYFYAFKRINNGIVYFGQCFGTIDPIMHKH